MPEYGSIYSGAIRRDLERLSRLQRAICQVSQSATQTINDNTATLVNFDVTDVDPLRWFNASNDRITPTIRGWYRVAVQGQWQSDGDYVRAQMECRFNGTTGLVPRWITEQHIDVAAVSKVPLVGNTFPLVLMNGTTDYFDFTCYQDNGSNNTNTIRAQAMLELVLPT